MEYNQSSNVATTQTSTSVTDLLGRLLPLLGCFYSQVVHEVSLGEGGAQKSDVTHEHAQLEILFSTARRKHDNAVRCVNFLSCTWQLVNDIRRAIVTLPYPAN